MLRRPPWGASHSQRSPWLLLHAVEACQLTVFTAELLDGGAMRPTPLFAYRLPARTLPGSLSLGQHAIFCACDAGEGEGVDEPSQPLSSHSQLDPGSLSRTLVVSNPPWGNNIGEGLDGKAIVTSVTSQFAGATMCWIANPLAVEALRCLPGVTVLRHVPFGSVELVVCTASRF